PADTAAHEMARNSAATSRLAGTLDPNIVRCGKRAAGLAGIYDAPRFDQQRSTFMRRTGDVLDPFRHDEHLALADNDATLSKANFHFTLEHQKYLVCVLVVVPHKLPFQLDELELVVVHLGHHARRPML